MISIAEADDTLKVCISGGAEKPYMPQARTWTLRFCDVTACAAVSATADGAPLAVQAATDPDGCLVLTLPALAVSARVEVELQKPCARENPPYRERIRDILTHYNAGNNAKTVTYMGLKNKPTPESAAAAARRVKSRALREELLEALCDME